MRITEILVEQQLKEEIRIPKIAAGNYPEDSEILPEFSKGNFVGFKINTGFLGKKYRYSADEIRSIKHLSVQSKNKGRSTDGSIGRAAVGGFFFGGVGALIGAGTAKNEFDDSNMYGIEFTDGKKVIVDVPKGTIWGKLFNKAVNDRIDFDFGTQKEKEVGPDTPEKEPEQGFFSKMFKSKDKEVPKNIEPELDNSPATKSSTRKSVSKNIEPTTDTTKSSIRKPSTRKSKPEEKPTEPETKKSVKMADLPVSVRHKAKAGNPNLR
jgi:hypothetical protein